MEYYTKMDTFDKLHECMIIFGHMRANKLKKGQFSCQENLQNVSIYTERVQQRFFCRHGENGEKIDDANGNGDDPP